MENNALEQLGFIMGDWIPKEASIAIALGERYIYYKAGTVDLRIQPGQAVESGSVASSTYIEGKRVEMLMKTSVFSSSYYGIGYPVNITGEPGALIIILPPDYPIRKKRPLQFLTGKLEDTWRPVPIEKVSHIESSQKKTWFYAEDEMYCSIHTLKNLKHQLPDTFLSIHRSFIVNIHFIEEISRDMSSNYLLTLKDGSLLPVSQNYATSVRERLGF